MILGINSFSETYDVSWSGILEKTVSQIKSGNEKIINPVLVLLAFNCYKNFFSHNKVYVKCSTGFSNSRIHKDTSEFLYVLIYHQK